MIVEVAIAHLAELAPMYAESLALLTSVEQRRAARYARPEPREEFVLTRALVRLLLSAKCGVAAPEIVITEGPHGKPAVDGMQFNISHSHGLAAIAFAEASVGIDIERIDPSMNWAELAGEVELSPAAFSGKDGEAARREFYQAWTRREAMAKCSGVGLGHDRDCGMVRQASVCSACELVLPVPYVGTLACAGIMSRVVTKHVSAAAIKQQVSNVYASLCC